MCQAQSRTMRFLDDKINDFIFPLSQNIEVGGFIISKFWRFFIIQVMFVSKQNFIHIHGVFRESGITLIKRDILSVKW